MELLWIILSKLSSCRSCGFLCLWTKLYFLFFTYFSISLVFLVCFTIFGIYLESTQNFTLFFCLFSIHIIKFCAVSLLMGVVILIILGYFSIFKTCKKSITYCFLFFTQKNWYIKNRSDELFRPLHPIYLICKGYAFTLDVFYLKLDKSA